MSLTPAVLIRTWILVIISLLYTVSPTASSTTSSGSGTEETDSPRIPNIVHQIYDYQSPNFFFYLSLLTVQTFLQPSKHILYVNDEGRYRKAHWDGWLSKAREAMKKKVSTATTTTTTTITTPMTPLEIHNPDIVDYTSYLTHFVSLIDSHRIEIRLVTFPSYPPHNTTTYASNKAHKSDFLRMEVLQQDGGIYLDTDVFINPSTSSYHTIGTGTTAGRRYVSTTHPLSHLRREHDFIIGFDNIVNIDDYTPIKYEKVGELTSQLPIQSLPKRMNNGVLLSSSNNSFLTLWQREYTKAYHANSFDYDSSVVPYRLSTMYPDLVHVEMNRLSPISFSFQTSRLAEAITCGIYIDDVTTYPDIVQRFPSVLASNKKRKTSSAIWYPVYDVKTKQYRYEANTEGPDTYMMQAVTRKLLFHLTMSQVR